MQAPRQIEIWFFIGALLLIYGVLITAAGLFHLAHPLPRHVALEDLHADIWWGALLIALGSFYTKRFWPWRRS